MKVTRSKSGTGNPGDVVGNQKAAACATGDSPGMWICLDLKGLRVRPTHYALRHGFKQEFHFLRHWRLEASIDGEVWILLREHINDDSIQHGFDTAGSSHVWELPRVLGWFRYLRLAQTGKNSSNRDSLAVSGLEILTLTLTLTPNPNWTVTGLEIYGQLLEHGAKPDNHIPRLNTSTV